MCGISGILGDVTEADSIRVKRMNEVQKHRGPDADVVRMYAGAVLGHRRLSIIDLSRNAEQPMETPDGKYVLVFNGEIYNYKELRRELSGYPFKTDGDSEVLLAAWDAWGENCLEKLRGMFAFCVWDTQKQKAFFARDRFGQKPFFFSYFGKQIVFASEAKALLAAGLKARPNLNTWSRYLTCASYDDDETSFFEGVLQLRPGECASWSREVGLVRRTYYSLQDQVPEQPFDVSVSEASLRVREMLFEATNLHMRSDVPVGVSLSGGLDSSALLACIDAGGKLDDLVHCFSFDFGDDFSERPWIEAAASHHGLESEIRSFSPEAFLASLKPLTWHLEGPIGGLANCALSLVYKMARERGVTVLQDGTGLDEAFAGYRNHHNLHVGLMLELGGHDSLLAAEEYAKIWGVDIVEARRIGEAELARTRIGKQTSIDGTLPTRPDLLSPALLSTYGNQSVLIPNKPDLMRAALIDYLQVRKVPRNTRMKDRLSMAYGIELRLPFLDHVLVEYALSIPPKYYFMHGRTKSIVREALSGVMDDSVRIAKKRSIQAPQGAWLMNQPMKSYIGDLITSSSFSDRGIFDQKKVVAAFDTFCKEGAKNSFFVWQWINVELWFRMFIDKPFKAESTYASFFSKSQ